MTLLFKHWCGGVAVGSSGTVLLGLSTTGFSICKVICCWFCIKLINGWSAFYGVKCVGSNCVLCWVQVWVVFNPSLYLLVLIGKNFASWWHGDAILLWTGSTALLMPSYMPLLLPDKAAAWMSCCQYSLTQCLPVCWALLLVTQSVCRFLCACLLWLKLSLRNLL